jgi:SAM-dependent methyltransferase
MKEPFEDIAQFYNKLVNRYGHDPRACDYGRVESQIAKFKVLAEVCPLDHCRLLDVGCGFADYADFLATGNQSVDYTGIDLSAGMIETASQLHPKLKLNHGNLLTFEESQRFDVVNANGIFYLLGEDAPVLVKRLIEKMYSLASRAVVFNSLSTWATHYEPGEFYANPVEILRFCRSLTPWVTLRHDYLPHDFTIYMYRDRQCD